MSGLSAHAKERSGIKRQIKLPNREAVKIALRSLKIRMWRSLITMAGIVLAIAFLTSVVVSGVIAQGIRETTGERVGATAQERATQVWLIAISLLVCVVGISNAMLMSVTERYREIGTMKCLGALDWFVVKLFLLEAGFLGLAGSALGALLGLATAMLAGMSQYDNVFSAVHWGRVSLSLLATIGVGGRSSTRSAARPGRCPTRVGT